jgi:hypothetical protein
MIRNIGGLENTRRVEASQCAKLSNNDNDLTQDSGQSGEISQLRPAAAINLQTHGG